MDEQNATGRSWSAGGEESRLAADYLLGRLTDAETEQVHQRLLLDDEFFHEVRLAEDDLLDDWAQGILAPADRARLEGRMLASPEIRARAGIAVALTPGSLASAKDWQGGGAPARGKLLAVAACLLLGFSTLWLGARNESLRKQVASLDKPPARIPEVVSLVLRSDTVRGEATIPSVRVAPSAEFVRIDLRLNPAEPDSRYSVVVKTQKGTLIWRRDGLSPDGTGTGRRVRLWLPATAFPPGRYEIELLAGAEPVGFYELDVAR